MKYIILLLIGLVSVATALPDKRDLPSNLEQHSEISSIEPVSEANNAESAKEPTKEVKAEETKPKPVDVVKENPNKCDTTTEWIYPDGTCHKKAVADTKPSSAVTSTGGCELVYNYTNWNQKIAYAVCMAESSGDPSNENLTDVHRNADGSIRCIGSFGLMQLACFWIPNPKDPIANMAKANEIYSRSGWSPWGAYTSGKYLKYL